MTPRDGGPAFPVEGYWNDDGTFRCGMQTGKTSGWFSGMTLRDYFAAKAMESQIAAGADVEMRGHEGWRDEFAREAYRYADAMLRAREVQS